VKINKSDAVQAIKQIVTKMGDNRRRRVIIDLTPVTTKAVKLRVSPAQCRLTWQACVIIGTCLLGHS